MIIRKFKQSRLAFTLVGLSRPLSMTLTKACDVFSDSSSLLKTSFACILLLLTISGDAPLRAQETDAAKPAPEAPVPGKKPPEAPTGPADAQLEKLATESEKEAAEPEAKPEKKKAAETAEKPTAKADKKKSKKDRDKDGGAFRPDFRDQEIQDILKIFSKIIGKNIIADEKVKGKITVISPYKIPRSLAYPYLYSMLAIKGFGIIEENENLIRVVAMKDALAGSPLIFLGREEIKDAEVKSDLPVTQILPVYGGKPSRLSAILKRLTSTNTDLIDYDDISMLIITGSQFEVNRLIRVANLIDYKGTPVEECDKVKDPDCDKVREYGNVHVYRLENMQAENVEATLKKVQLPIEPVAAPTPSAGGGAPAPAVTQANTQKKPIDVVGHKETNSIIFVGTNDEFELVKSLIKRIDLQRQQVLLEVLIVEVGVDNTNEFGIDWIVGQGGSAQFNSNAIATKSGYIGTDGSINTSRPTSLPGLTLTFADQSITSILGILNAHIGRSNFLVVSAPQILTLDNQEAEINVGQDQPVRVNSLQTQVGSTSQSFEYRPVGIKLKFTPQVNKNRMVMLNLFQEVKTINATDSASGNPIISKKDIKTFVRVQDGQTIVIGGLVSSDRRTEMKKVPILGDLPLLGYLFKRIGTSNKRSNLMVFITPHVLTNRAVADKVTDDLRKDQVKELRRGQID